MNAPLDPIQLIEARRIAAGVSMEGLAGAASVSLSHYRRLRMGAEVPRRATVARLRAALSRLTGRPSELAVPEIRMVLYAYFAVLGLVCAKAGVATTEVHAQDPALRATANKAWLRAARLRAQAVYLVHCGLGIAQTDIAKATGQTPAAISLACQRIEDAREDEATDRLMDELTRAITGEVG